MLLVVWVLYLPVQWTGHPISGTLYLCTCEVERAIPESFVEDRLEHDDDAKGLQLWESCRSCRKHGDEPSSWRQSTRIGPPQLHSIQEVDLHLSVHITSAFGCEVLL